MLLNFLYLFPSIRKGLGAQDRQVSTWAYFGEGYRQGCDKKPEKKIEIGEERVYLYNCFGKDRSEIRALTTKRKKTGMSISPG